MTALTARLGCEQLYDRCLPSAGLIAPTAPQIIGQHIGMSVVVAETDIIHRHPGVVETDATQGTHGGGGGGGSGKAS